MKALGIVAEYNPFHEGHKYLINTASALTKADVCISAISGNFVQRGGFAYFDKWERAKEAVMGGVDLVIEIPQIYASGSSRIFAEGGIRILNALGAEFLAFGSEYGNIEALNRTAEMIREGEGKYASDIRKEMKKGLSYPAAISTVMGSRYADIDMDILKGPNDILALEYIMAIRRNNLNMTPVAIKRTGDGHRKTGTKIREELNSDPEFGPIIKSMEQKYFDHLRGKIITMTADEIESYDTATEGLGNKIKDEIRNASDLDDLIERVKSKRYTYTRISRLLSHIALGIKPELYLRPASKSGIVATTIAPTYIRPLAMNDKGAKYIKSVKKTAESRGITFVDDAAKVMKYGNTELTKILEIDIRAADLYSILRGNDMYQESDYVKKTVIL